MRVEILERVSAFTTLGIRFWDAALDRPVESARLIVSARPANRPEARPVRAFRTASGVYALMGLPGLRRVETMAEDAPAAPRRFVVEVDDPSGTFLSLAFAVELPLPYRGVLLGPEAGSPAQPGFMLVPAPTRRAPAGHAVVRGELARAADGRPAAHAVVAATDPDGGVAEGVADAAGRFALLLPWPAPALPATASPGVGGAASVGAQGWDVAVSARLATPGPAPIPGFDRPDWGEVLAQPAADVWPAAPSAGGAPAPAWTGRLEAGADLVVRTAGLSRLLVGPPPPP